MGPSDQAGVERVAQVDHRLRRLPRVRLHLLRQWQVVRQDAPAEVEAQMVDLWAGLVAPMAEDRQADAPRLQVAEGQQVEVVRMVVGPLVAAHRPMVVALQVLVAQFGLLPAALWAAEVEDLALVAQSASQEGPLEAVPQREAVAAQEAEAVRGAAQEEALALDAAQEEAVPDAVAVAAPRVAGQAEADRQMAVADPAVVAAAAPRAAGQVEERHGAAGRAEL